MDDIFNDADHYLSHHGILGMKWGKKNGPPYPLSDAKHDRIIKKAEKRRQKILKDPKKLYKHSEEFTKEELQEALDKIRVAKQVQREIPEKKKKYKKEKEVKLSRMQRKWARDPFELSKHADRYNEKEFEKAKVLLENNQYIFDKKLQKANRPKRVIDIGLGYLSSITNLISGAKLFKKEITPYDPNKLTNAEKHKDFLVRKGYTWLLDRDTTGALDTQTRNKTLARAILAIQPDWEVKEEKRDPLRERLKVADEYREANKLSENDYNWVVKEILKGYNSNNNGGGKKKKGKR